MDLPDLNTKGLSITPVEQVPAEPDDKMMRLATMAHIADTSINGADAKDFTTWLQMTHGGRELEARQTLAVQKATKDFDALVLNETKNPTVSTQEFFQAISDQENERFKARYRSIFEEETGKAIVDGSFTDPVRAAVIDTEELSTDIDVSERTGLEQSTNLSAALLKLDNMRVKYAKIISDKGIASNVAEVASMIAIPFFDTATQFIAGERNIETLGSALEKDSSKFYNSQDPVKLLEDIEQKLEKAEWLPDILKFDFLESLSISGGEATLRTAFEVADVLGVYGTIRALSKLPKMARISKISKTANNPKMSVDQTEELSGKKAAGDKLTLEEEEDLIENVIPSSGGAYRNSTSGAASQVLEEQAQQLEVIKTVKGQSFLSDEEAASALEQLTKELKNSLPRVTIADVGEPDSAGRIPFILGTGKKGTSAFTSEEAAKAGGERMGIMPGFFNVVKRDGLYFVEVKRDLPTFSLKTGESILEPMVTDSNRIWPLPWKYFGPRGLAGNKIVLKHQPRLAEGGIQGTNALAKLNDIFKTTTKIFSTLPKNSRRSFEAIMQHTQQNNNGRWLTNNEVNNFYLSNYNRKPTDKEIAAYGGTIQLHQADEYVINFSIRSEFVNKGYIELGVKGVREDPTIGKVISAFDRKNSKNHSILDATTGELYKEGSNSTKILQKLTDDDNLILIKYLQPVETEFGMAKYIVANKKNVNQTAIRARVLNHFDGPHREYETPIFIKQPVVKDIEGSSTLTKYRTHYNVGSEKQAVKVAKDYNEALGAFLRGEKYKKAGYGFDDGDVGPTSSAVKGTDPITEATNIINTRTRYASFDEFEEAIESGEIERTPFEAWADKGTRPLNFKPGTSTQDQFVNNPDAIDLDPDIMNMSESARKYIDRGRLYYSSRGDHLKNPDGELAPVLNYTESLEKSMAHVMNTRAFSDYKSRNIRNWVETYKPFLNDGDIMRPDWYHYHHGTFKDDTPMKVREMASRSREGLDRIVHAKSKEARKVDRFKYELAQYVMDADNSAMSKIGANGLLKVVDNQGISAVRALTFKTFLGMLDASQIGLQLSMTPAVLSVAPRLGPQALAMLLPLRMAAQLDNPSAIDHLSSIISTIAVPTGRKMLKTKEVRMLIEDMKRSGVDIVGGTQAQLDNPFDGNIIYNNKLISFANRALDVGLVPFKEGERLNQTLGFTISWLEHFNKYGTRPKGDELGRVLNRAETFSGNMKSSSRAAYQNGPMSIPMQFATHPIRVAEQILEQSGGFSKGEKIRWLTGIGLAYGTAGLGIDTVVDYMSDFHYEATGERLTPELRRKLSDGYVGQIFEGQDISRLQPLDNNIMQKIWKAAFTDESVPSSELLGGPSRALVGDWAETMGSSLLIKGLKEGTLSLSKDVPEEAFDLAKELFLDLPNPSRIHKAWRMHQESILMTKSGKFLDRKNYSPFDVMMTGLGLPPRLSKEVYESTLKMGDLQKEISKDAAQFSGYIRDMLITDDKDKAARLSRKAQRLRDLYYAQEKPHIIKAWNNATGNALTNMTKEATQESIQRLYKFFGSEYVNSMLNLRRE